MCAVNNLGYNPSDEDSILVFASHLEGQSLNEAIPNYERTFDGGRGTFGLILNRVFRS